MARKMKKKNRFAKEMDWMCKDQRKYMVRNEYDINIEIIKQTNGIGFVLRSHQLFIEYYTLTL